MLFLYMQLGLFILRSKHIFNNIIDFLYIVLNHKNSLLLLLGLSFSQILFVQFYLETFM